MNKTWIAVYAVLVIVAGLLGRQIFVSAKRFGAENDLAKMVPVTDVKQKISAEGEIPPLPPPRRYNPSDFVSIPNQNLFSETRAREERTDVQPVLEVPPLAVKPVMVGVTIFGSQRQALIIDPTAGSQGRNNAIKKLGDVYQGYVITDITDSQMVLENGPRREVIPLFEGSKHNNQAGRTPIIATRVIPFGAGSAAGGIPIVAGGGQPSVISGSGPARGSGIGGTGMINNPVRETPVPIGSSRGVIQPNQQTQPGRGIQSPSPSFNQGTDTQGRRVIRTPFGDIEQPATKPPNNP